MEGLKDCTKDKASLMNGADKDYKLLIGLEDEGEPYFLFVNRLNDINITVYDNEEIKLISRFVNERNGTV